MKPRLVVPTVAVLLALLLGVVIVGPVAAQSSAAGWNAFLTDKKGKTKEFPDNPTKLKDKDWLRIGYTDFTGYKPRLGVTLSEETQVTSREFYTEWARLLSELYGRPRQGTNPLNHVEDLVRQALGATNRFTMVERTTAVGDVLGEQDFGASGRVDRKTAARIGKMAGARYVVKATIIELNPEKEAKDIQAIGGGMGTSALGIGSVGVSGKVAFARLNVRLIDSETGVIAQDMTVDGTSKSSGLRIGGGLIGRVAGGIGGGGVGVGSKKAASISDALQACANKIAYHVANKFEDLPWEGAVASVSGGTIRVNGGRNVGLKTGMSLKLMSKGEEVLDPDTGESLGFETMELGMLRVVSVAEKFATCELVEGGEGIKRGDVVRLESRK
jgi:curli biogenesis system outer membrane secretion channel CsgG